ncbi:ABC transporter permease [Thiocapsa marina]|uniref:ABC-2 type transporter n=1 Tax=Thiocapsa marina 5811 TaxID=768671 RepID=F9UEY7_9GAMM|nr:ABC transporter permease [Thiocapsa marina]EGV17458.1 ABC-2 type transporter [Thiocapsa marina 5811]
MTTHRQLPITVYSPGSAMRQPSQLLADLFRDVCRGRGLAWRLAVRDISAQYRQAALGLLWALILPLANTAVWLFLNGSGIVQISETPLPYAVYVFTGTMLWAIFMDAMNAPLQQATAAKAMLAKINFPREALVMSGILQTLFNGGIKIALLLVVLLFFGIYPSWPLLLFPIGVASLILAGTAFGLLLTPVGLLYTDIGKGLPLVLQFLMYLTPVVFPMPTSGWALTLFSWNPLTPLILTARDWLTGLPGDLLGPFLLVNAILLVLLLFMGIVFRLAMPMLIERMGS